MLVGGEESDDGFMFFVETIKRYEGAIDITTDTENVATEVARLADVARNNLMWAARSSAFGDADSTSFSS